MSDGKPAPQNIQDAFLNTVRREKTTVMIYLVNGAKLTGRIRSFDKFSLLLESGAQEQLVFKHAISTISQSRRGSGDLRPQVPAELSANETPSPVVNQPTTPVASQTFDQPRDSPES
jgi:host factor-I protein